MMNQLKTMPKAWLGDQAVINKAIGKKIVSVLPLNNKWNTTKRQIVDGRMKNYHSCHFVGRKPWVGDDKKFKHLEDLWWSYAK